MQLESATRQRRRRLLFRFTTLVFLGATATLAAAQQPADANRGALLYDTHCITCHSTQMHWRTATLVTDWDSLKYQVRRWQGNAGLQWGEADIAEVARHLNNTIYRLPAPAERVGRAAAGGAARETWP